MGEMRCFGYYIVKPLKRPEWCTVETSRILSVSENGLSEKFPDLEKCFWVNYPEHYRAEYQEYLGLGDEGFAEFCGFVNELFNSRRLSTDVRFSSIEEAVRMYRYLRNTEGFRIVGIYTSAEIYAEYESEGTFDTIMAGVESQLPKHRLGNEILGCEGLDNGYFCFDSYIVNSLDKELRERSDRPYITDSDTGLILNTFEDTGYFCSLIQGKGEPVIWTPFEVYEFDTE